MSTTEGFRGLELHRHVRNRGGAHIPLNVEGTNNRVGWDTLYLSSS